MAESKEEIEAMLAHSGDEDEWDDAPETIERRPSGMRVVSARLPIDLADRLVERAKAMNVRPSDVIRDALERSFRQTAFDPVLNTGNGLNLRVMGIQEAYGTENPLVSVVDEPLELVSLGFSRSERSTSD